METIAFRLDPRVRSLLESVARREGRSLGEVLREAVAEWLSGRTRLHNGGEAKPESKD